LKVLIVKPSSLGDVIHALPVVRLIRAHLPTARIDWFINRELTPLLEGDPDLYRLFPFDRRGWRGPLGWPEAWSTVQELRAQRYDWVIDLQSLARSGLLAWLSRGQFTIGLADSREGAPAFHDVSVPRPSAQTHAVDWYLEVLRPLGIPIHDRYTWLPEREWAAAPVRARVAAQPGVRWIGLQPGARWLNKRWPVEHFATLARQLAQDPGLRVVVFGSKGDAPLGDTLAAASPDRILNLCGRISLPEVIEWLRRCAVLVTNDTGPMHLAAAVGTRVVAAFGPTSPERTGPYGQLEQALHVSLPCAPCLKSECHYQEPLACLRRLEPTRVLAEVRRQLDRVP
jgi:heptosyltransferase-1